MRYFVCGDFETRLIATWVGAVCLALTLVGLGTGSALGQMVTEFSSGISAGAQPLGITAGPDGNLWFTEYKGNRIGKITPAGVITEYSAGISISSVGAGALNGCNNVKAGPDGITAGPDGNMWFTEICIDRIGKITPAGVVTEYSNGITAGAGPDSITVGPDGNLWFTEYYGNRIGKITPAGVVTEYSTGITSSAYPAYPAGITAGPDGNLWFTELIGNQIGKITPAGVITEYSRGIHNGGYFDFAHPLGITAGPDGNLWFTESEGNRIGKITPAYGVVTEYGTGVSKDAGALGACPYGIAAGPDGNLWFTESCIGRIGKITPAGVLTDYSSGITANANNITAGPDGNLWFTEMDGNRIGRVNLTKISPTSNFFPYSGSSTGNGTVAVSAPGAWTAESSVSWLSIVSGATGSGNGSVTFSVAANSTGAQRVGTLTIAGQTFTVTQLGPPPTTGGAQIVEYYDSVDDDYFITADPTEQAELDAAALAGAVWSRTGMTFNSGGSASVYRFIYKSPGGVNTHFYTANTNEQSSLLGNNSIWVLETPVAFYMTAAPTQTCPAGSVPVYRAANLQTGSHRFTTIQSAITDVLARDWTNEGIAFCAPP